MTSVALLSKLMQILVVSQRCCIRTLKQITALSHSHQVHVLTKRIPEGTNCATRTYYDGTEYQLREALKLFQCVDIVYAASEPSWVVFAIREVLKKPIVLDVHDAQIWRTTDVRHRSAEERLAFRWVDALVVPSNPCKRILKSSLPTVVLPPYVNEKSYFTRSWGWRGGIVYQGRVDLPKQSSFMDYAKYDGLAMELDKEGIQFHIYCPGNTKDLEPWKKLYEPICHFHKGLPYEKMISVLGFYDWGLCGNLGNYREWNLAMPNKLFDYMAGGIPIIAMNAKETGRFVERHKIGISVKSIQEIKDRWDEREECQKNVFLKRHDWAMEKHIGRLERLFTEVLERVPRQKN